MTGRSEIDLPKTTGVAAQPRLREDYQLYIPAIEWQKLVAAAEAFDKTLLMRDTLWFMGETSLRIGEVLALRVHHAVVGDPHRAFIDVRKSRRINEHRQVEDANPKSFSMGKVPIPHALAVRIQEVYVQGRPLGAALFPSPRRGDEGWTYNSWYARWARLLKSAVSDFDLDSSLSIHPHALRANGLTWAMEKGVDTRDARRLGRHRHIATTEGYDRGSAAPWMHRVREKQGGFTPASELDDKQ